MIERRERHRQLFHKKLSPLKEWLTEVLFCLISLIIYFRKKQKQKYPMPCSLPQPLEKNIVYQIPHENENLSAYGIDTHHWQR